ncbi:GIY-YIG nuclease family protein [Asticcacaulis sp.]|uniref:GIY-YIG nuclease family protein n=1 Tax=Asticcacaulis sp. TaxID=1872648 RepID=UPI00262DAEBD|nr:GIY-YIG nuclease family protein [Asticcacaulis sp.]
MEEHAQSEAFRVFLVDVIASAVPLRAPLYVGQTGGLRRRIKDHLAPGSGLATRLRSADIQIENCTLAYRLMPDSDLYKDEQTLTLIEEIVTRLIRPGFVGRIG